MGNRTLDELGAVQQVIRISTPFYKEYEGKVLDNADPLRKGRIKVEVPELNWKLAATVPWVMPEYDMGQVTPMVGKYVLVRFLYGRYDCPIYRGKSSRLMDSAVADYVDQNTSVVYYDDNDKLSVVYHRDTEVLNVKQSLVTTDVDAKNGTLDVKLDGATLKVDGKGKELHLAVGDVKIDLVSDKISITGASEAEILGSTDKAAMYGALVQDLNTWYTSLKSALQAAIVAQAPSGTAPITWTVPLPEAPDLPNSESSVGVKA